jgi:hypothetical protein
MIFGKYLHLKSSNLYKVIGLARLVSNPNEQFIIYKQLYKSKLFRTEINLPKGSLWIRKQENFNSKFIKVANYNVVNKIKENNTKL